MPMSRIKEQVDEILECCNEKQIRCTYEAVGEVLGVPAHAVNHRILGKKRQEASWIVGVNSGIPKDYDAERLHPNLFTTNRIIKSGTELKNEIDAWRMSRS